MCGRKCGETYTVHDWNWVKIETFQKKKLIIYDVNGFFFGGGDDIFEYLSKMI